MSTGLVETLRESRQRCWEQLKDVAKAASDEKRPMTAEENRKWEVGNAELNDLDDKIKNTLEGQQNAKDAEMRVQRLEGRPVEIPGGHVELPQIDYAKEIRKLHHAVPGTGFDIPLPSIMEQRAINAYVERRTLLDSNVPLPTSFVGQLYRVLVDTSTIRQANPTVFSTSTGENLVVPRATAYGVAQWTAEGGTLSAADPTVSSVTLGAHKLGVLVQVSRELLDDEGFDIVGFVASEAGMIVGIAVDTAYVAGTGTTQPLGFLGSALVGAQAITGTGSTVGLPTGLGTGTVSLVGADALIELYHSVIPQYRKRASWIMHDSTVKIVRKLKDTTGQYIWQPALVAGQPDTILGRPVYPDPHMPQIGVSTTPIAFGDFKGYFIRDVTPLRFERSDEFAFGTDLVSFRVIYRTDGALADTSAVKTYATAAS